jgi:hypothetical protein
MLSGRTVSIDLLIEQLYRNYGFENVDKSEVAEWIWESMGIIGTPYPYEDKIVELDTIEYRAALPINLYSVGMVREKTTGIPLREMTDMFFKFGLSAYEGTTEIEADTDPATGDHYDTIIGPTTSSEYYTFKTQGNWIYTGIETGTIEMSYKAIPIDIVTGLPTIPDNVRYIRGVVSFIAERMAFRMFMKDLITETKYNYILKDYLFNVGAAQSECILPDPSRMETMLNRWKSTYLGTEHFDSGFKYLGARE